MNCGFLTIGFMNRTSPAECFYVNIASTVVCKSFVLGLSHDCERFAKVIYVGGRQQTKLLMSFFLAPLPRRKEFCRRFYEKKSRKGFKEILIHWRNNNNNKINNRIFTYCDHYARSRYCCCCDCRRIADGRTGVCYEKLFQGWAAHAKLPFQL